MRPILLLLTLLPFSIALAAAPGAADPPPKVPDAVPDRFLPAPFETQTVTGLLGERMRINLDKRLLAIEEDALLAGFRHQPGEQEWIGEHIGKYLDAAANTWRYTR